MKLDRNATLRATITRSSLSKTILFNSGKFLLSNNSIFIQATQETILDVYLGKVGNNDIWAVETPFSSDQFVELRPNLFKLSPIDQKLVGLGYSMINWNLNNQFCSHCGSKTKSVEAGYKRVCFNTECKCNKSLQNTCYPRLDPVVIVMVKTEDNKTILLGRQKQWEPFRYSCIAGFVENGELLEEACEREVYEESGISITNAKYVTSQAWPFPSQLMIGFEATSTSTEINLIDQELEDCRWFSRDEVELAMKGECAHLKLAPQFTIANKLITTWLSSE